MALERAAAPKLATGAADVAVVAIAWVVVVVDVRCGGVENVVVEDVVNAVGAAVGLQYLCMVSGVDGGRDKYEGSVTFIGDFTHRYNRAGAFNFLGQQLSFSRIFGR